MNRVYKVSRLTTNESYRGDELLLVCPFEAIGLLFGIDKTSLMIGALEHRFNAFNSSASIAVERALWSCLDSLRKVHSNNLALKNIATYLN